MADFGAGQGAAYTEAPFAGEPIYDEVQRRPLTRADLRLAEVPTTHDVQAAAEGVVLDDDPDLIEFMGKKFRIAERVGLMPMLAFANAAKNGLDSDDMEGLAAMYALVRDVVDQTRVQKLDDSGEPMWEEDGTPQWAGPSQWQLFERHAMEQQAEGEDIMDFVNKAMARVAARPRRRREISSGGSPQTSPKSRVASSSPVTPPEADGLVDVSLLGR